MGGGRPVIGLMTLLAQCRSLVGHTQEVAKAVIVRIVASRALKALLVIEWQMRWQRVGITQFAFARREGSIVDE